MKFEKIKDPNNHNDMHSVFLGRLTRCNSEVSLEQEVSCNET
jgi:hypothetical protein